MEAMKKSKYVLTDWEPNNPDKWNSGACLAHPGDFHLFPNFGVHCMVPGLRNRPQT